MICNYEITSLTQPSYFSKAATVFFFKSQRHQDQCPLLTKAEDMQKESAFGQQFIYITTR